MAAIRKPAPFFEAVLSGPHVVPEAIPIGAVSRVLSAVHRLAAGVEVPDEDESDQRQADDSSVRLLDIKRGSCVFRFTGVHPEEPLHRLRLVNDVLHDPDKIGDNTYMLSPLEELSAVAKSQKCTIIIRKSNRDGVIAKIEPTSFEMVSKSVFVHGGSAITGLVERVGGVTALKCGLRVSFQPRMLICKVATPDIARQIGERLYQEIVANGNARWFKSSWKLFSFEITSVQQLKQGTIMEAMEAIRDAGGDGWDKIDDPQEFLEGAGSRK